MASRNDQAPRVVFVGDANCRRHTPACHGRGPDADSASRWIRMAAAYCTRATSPEAALVLLGLPNLRNGASSLVARGAPFRLSGLLAEGNVPTIESTLRGVSLGWRPTDDLDPSFRPAASAE